jgi:hypothetical protein
MRISGIEDSQMLGYVIQVSCWDCEARMNDGNTFFEWLDKGLLVTGDNLDLNEKFSQSNDDKLYVDAIHTPDYIFREWTRFFCSVKIIEAPTVYSHDFVVCIK